MVALLLSACTSSAADDRSQTDPASASPRAADADADDQVVPPDDGGGEASGPSDHRDGTDDADDAADGERSVLGAYLGYEIPGLDPGDQAELRRIEQDTLARCMRDQGFTYIAWAPDPATVYAPVEEGLDPESREFAERYGFGVSTQFYAQRDVGPGLIGHSGDGSGTSFEENPNERIRQALSPEELEAYDRAFWGADNPLFVPSSDADEGEDDGILEARRMTSFGCIGESQRAIDGEASAVLDVFAIEILGMTERAIADPRYVRYANDVERCVNEAGYDFYANRPDWAVLAHFDQLMFEIDELVGGNPFDQLTEVQLAAMSPAEIDALHDAPRELSIEAKDQLAEVQALETATAVTVWDCGGNRGEQRRVVDEIVADLQARFIADNRDELERFRR